jgi:hypothetical protein
MSKFIEKGGISTISLETALNSQEKRNLEKKVVEIREQLVKAQIENRKQLPFASPDTLKRIFR